MTGSSAARREAAIAALLAPAEPAALILEGLPAGDDPFAEYGHLKLARIALGCVCCTGNLTLRVTLNRLLRQKPARLFIGIASSEHLPTIIEFLQNPPYDAWLRLQPLVAAD